MIDPLGKIPVEARAGVEGRDLPPGVDTVRASFFVLFFRAGVPWHRPSWFKFFSGNWIGLGLRIAGWMMTVRLPCSFLVTQENVDILT